MCVHLAVTVHYNETTVARGVFFEKEGITALSWLVHLKSFKTDPTIGWQTSCDKKKNPESVGETEIRAE